jgi:hypothetical protein
VWRLALLSLDGWDAFWLGSVTWEYLWAGSFWKERIVGGIGNNGTGDDPVQRK